MRPKVRVSIEADNYYFEPSVLQPTPGQKLTLTIVNKSSTEYHKSYGMAGGLLSSGDKAGGPASTPSSSSGTTTGWG